MSREKAKPYNMSELHILDYRNNRTSLRILEIASVVDKNSLLWHNIIDILCLVNPSNQGELLC